MSKKEPIGLDKDIKELIIRLGSKLTDRNEIDMLSQIFHKEDQNFSKLLLVDEMLGLDSISLWVRTILSLRVSLGRKGRKEIIQVLKNLFVTTEKDGKTSMTLKRILEGDEG